MVCFSLSLLKPKLPQRCPKRGGGGPRPLLDNVQKEAAFFFRITSLIYHLQYICQLEMMAILCLFNLESDKFTILYVPAQNTGVSWSFFVKIYSKHLYSLPNRKSQVPENIRPPCVPYHVLRVTICHVSCVMCHIFFSCPEQLLKSSCPSVGWLVGRSVGWLVMFVK